VQGSGQTGNRRLLHRPEELNEVSWKAPPAFLYKQYEYGTIEGGHVHENGTLEGTRSFSFPVLLFVRGGFVSPGCGRS